MRHLTVILHRCNKLLIVKFIARNLQWATDEDVLRKVSRTQVHKGYIKTIFFYH